jgi:hypothetical protein
MIIVVLELITDGSQFGGSTSMLVKPDFILQHMLKTLKIGITGRICNLKIKMTLIVLGISCTTDTRIKLKSYLPM